MYKIKLSSQIKKDLKLAKKRHYDFTKFEFVVNKLANSEILDAKFQDHPLSGKYAGYRECHIENDWLLVYKIYKNEITLYLFRCGTHVI